MTSIEDHVRCSLPFYCINALNEYTTSDITAEETLVNAAHKELAYLEQFGEPLLPLERIRRETYQYKKQSPLDHIENLKRYLLIASSHVPKDPTLRHFRIRHPDLHPSNIIVSRSPDSSWQVTGLLDWQHASILPMFLLAGIPQRLQNYGDPVSESMTQPALPKNLDDLDEAERLPAKGLYHRRLVHYHYVKATEECSELHHKALTSHMGVLRRRLFDHASSLWDGETLELKVDLIESVERWEALTGGGAQCPIVFDAEDVRETKRLGKVQEGTDETMEAVRSMIECGEEGWAPTEDYEEAMARTKELKEAALAAATSAAERAEITKHWIFDDIDEDKYA